MKWKHPRNTDQVLVDAVVEDYQKRRTERRPLELQWRLNMNFFEGNQYAEITPVGDVEEFGKQYYWQEREVYNHIASIVETRLSKLMRTKTGVSVRPAGNDDTDLNAAKFATQILRSLAEDQRLSQLMNHASTWSEVTGTCFFKIEWDPNKGQRIGVDKAGKPVHEGDVSVSVVPPYELYPDRINCERLCECRSIIHAKVCHVDDIYDQWGVRVSGEDVEVFSSVHNRTTSDQGTYYGLGVSRTETDASYCTVIERYTKPSADHPDGELVIVAADKLLYQGPLPYVNDIDGQRGFPFVKIHSIDRVGCLFGTSIVERLIPLQRAYNAVKNRKHEFLNRIAMGVLAVEDGSIDTDSLEDEGLAPGKILTYRQGSNPPVMLNLGQVPPDFRSEEERILSEFITISGVSELSKYSQTYASMSGRAISLLVEQDDSRLSIASGSIREGFMEICKHMLRLYRQFATQPRLLRIAGENGEIEMRSFCASDLQSEDLVFDNENELSDTLASRRSMALELIGMGILQDEDGKVSARNKVRILDLLGFGNWESARDLDECQRKAAIRENLDTTDPLCVHEIDDHRIHIAEHTKAALSDTLDAGQKERLLAHIQDHKTAQIMQYQTDVSAMEMQEGSET